jgi:hypothetical protein
MKHLPDEVLDASLDLIATTGNMLHLCSAVPATYAAVAGVSLGNKALATGYGGGVYSKGDGLVSGRRLTVAQQNGIPIGTSGEANTAVIVDTATSKIRAVTEITPQQVTQNNNANTQAFGIELRDPLIN